MLDFHMPAWQLYATTYKVCQWWDRQYHLLLSPELQMFCVLMLMATHCAVIVGDSYLQHISSTSGASVTMRGRGSGGVYDRYDMAIASQPACVHSPYKQTDCVSTLWCLCCSPDHLHLFVSATNPKSFDDAKGLCVNLIDTVRAEHAKMFPPRLPQASQLPAQPQPHISVPPNMPHSQGGVPSGQYHCLQRQCWLAHVVLCFS